MQKIIQLVIASHNIHKIREFKWIFKEISNFEILSLLDFPNYIAKEEKGESFRQNAISKAENAAKQLNVWAIGDDSGLIVPSLNDEPGIYSARYAGENATDLDNRKKLLSNMEKLEGNDRDAYFECCIALASPEELKKCVCTTCEGRIIKKERGGGGFGYDPLFVKNEYNKTFAELDETTKNKISARRKAVDRLMLSLEIV